MSGIAGIFYRDGRPVVVEELKGMTDQLAYRGPDGVGHWAQGPVGLGHLQLCATPESLRERQPFKSPDGNYVIVCDGRVDNREELVRELARMAPVSAASTDVELVLYSYIAWKSDCLKRIIGDFAFVIWDGIKQRLFCARDPMGVRTFYYYQDDSRFVFGSDISALLAVAGIPRELNPLKIALHLLGNLNEAEQTHFKDILQVLPAHYLTVDRNKVSKHLYWEPTPLERLNYDTTGEYIEHFRQVFFEAVRCRMRSSGSVGISLSGGMDSTSVACAAAHLLAQGEAPDARLAAFSSVFNDFQSVDESAYIRQVADAWNIETHYIPADNLWGYKPVRNSRILWNQPYPLSFQARHEELLTRARDSGARTVLTGEGGDELLNPGFGFLLDQMKGLRLPSLYENLRHMSPQSRRYFYKTVASFYKAAAWELVPGPVKQLYRKRRPRKVPRWLNYEMVKQSGALEHRTMRLAGPKTRSIYQRTQYFGMINVSRSPFLSYITEMYAYHNIEARHPFLDRRVIDFLTRVPPHLKFQRGWTKYLLRQAMEGLLPDQVRLRSTKSTFTDVMVQGLRNEQARIRDILQHGYLVRCGWVDSREAEAIYEGLLVGDLTNSNALMTWVNMEDWRSHYFGSNGSGALEDPSTQLVAQNTE